MNITINDDFDLNKIANSGQCFRVKELENNRFRFITGEHILYIRKLEEACYEISSGKIDLADLYSRSDKKVFETLKQISGVGDKVSNCICLFAYGRTRLAPIDTWIKKVINQEYNGKNPFPRYKDAAGIMQQYIFYYALTHKKELNRLKKEVL